MIVGHENNLRSLVMQLDDVSKEDIVHVELPRAIPLLYYLDKKTLKPIRIPGAAPYLRGRYLADEKHLEKIQDRDYKQVYDLNTKENLEIKNPFAGMSLGISEL
jgi:2,3-bisphosphoglycerate-dependent phosphoglycerate mutase